MPPPPSVSLLLLLLLPTFAALAVRATNEVILSPPFEYAQSPDLVFINVKFAIRLAAPACLDLKDIVHDIAPETVSIKTNCMDKRFELRLELFEPIEPTASNWTLTSVGRGTFTLAKKAPNTKWRRLLKSPKKVKGMHIWYSKQHLYDSEMSKLISGDEDDDDDEGGGGDADDEEEEEEEESERGGDSGKRREVEANTPGGEALAKEKQELDAKLKELRRAANRKITEIENEVRAKKMRMEKDYEDSVKQLENDASRRVEEVSKGLQGDVQRVTLEHRAETERNRRQRAIDEELAKGEL